MKMVLQYYQFRLSMKKTEAFINSKGNGMMYNAAGLAHLGAKMKEFPEMLCFAVNFFLWCLKKLYMFSLLKQLTAKSTTKQDHIKSPLL